MSAIAELIDKFLTTDVARNVVPRDEVVDLLLDIRLLSDPTPAPEEPVPEPV